MIRKPVGHSRPTPYHQEGTYSPDKAYTLSVWSALDDVRKSSGCLEFLPGSHCDKLLPPVDYWNPDFQDLMARTPRWRRVAITVPVKAGDGVLFNPFVWHRSCPIETNDPRRAIAMRWALPDQEWSRTIPTPEEVEFGMYNCGDVTWNVLRNAYRDLFGTTHDDWELLRDSWRDQLKSGGLEFLDTRQALNALVRLQILNRAHRHHDTGDQQGSVYVQLWNELLEPLEERGEETDGIDGRTSS